MKKCLVYIHGKGGSVDEAEHYRPLFAGYDVIGFDYQAQTPWEAKSEFAAFFNSLQNIPITEAYFISPIADMENLIKNMMLRANVTEVELQQKGVISTEFGETLSWEYLSWVRTHPIEWNKSTHVLYGSNDNLQSLKDIKNFSAKISADITVMPSGEHWFHTKEQMHFLDSWITKIKTS